MINSIFSRICNKQNRLPACKRIALIVSLLAVLLGIALFFFFFLLEELNARREFSSKQLLGVEYIKPVFTLERDLLDYRYMVLSKRDDPFESQVLSLQRQIDHDIRTIHAVDLKFGADLSTTPSWEEIKQDWQVLRDVILHPPTQQVHESHAALIVNVNTLMSHVGDRSNLILDPDLDSYYLTETLVNRLPTLIEQLDQVRTRGSRLKEPSQLSPHERFQIANFKRMISLTQEAIRHNLDIVFTTTSNNTIQPRLASQLRTTDETIDAVLALLTLRATDPLPGEQQRNMAQAATEAMHAGAQLYDLVLSAMSDTVQTRIDTVARKKWLIEAVAVVTTLVVLLLFLVFRRSDAERSQAEAEIAEQESLLRAIVQGALDAVVTMDRNGLIVEWNPQAEVIFGFTAQEAVGKLLAEMIIPAQYREAHTKGMQRFVSTGQEKILRQRIEITALRRNGEEFSIELTVIPLRLNDNILFSSFLRDISERKRGEDTLRQTMSFFESLFEHLPSMVFVKDAKDLRFVRVNKAGEDLLGLQRSDLLGKNDHDFFSEQEAAFFAEKDRETLAGGVLVDIPEEPIQTKTHGLRLLHTKKIPICDFNGKPEYLLGISEDITERKQAEEALLKARLLAEEADKAKSDFLANMSHEMRTPLNAIIGINDYLARTTLSQEQLSLVNRCTTASDGLLRLIEDLLLAAKAESGTLEIVHTPFSLSEVVSECTQLMSMEAQEKWLLLTLHLEPNLPALVSGDAVRLQQVLLNLLRNAIKFTSAGQIDVWVRPLFGKDNGCQIQFSVSDTGIGISPEEQAQLFQRFSQADSRSNRRYGGVGLGLSISKQLVELMHGRIWVDSLKGRGTTFSFIIPFTVPDANPAQASGLHSTDPAPDARASTATDAPTRALRILLAEDSVESQEVIQLYLRSLPHRLDIVSNGILAVSKFKEHPYDLVLMDVNMPEMDGLTATKLIRAWEIAQGRRPAAIMTLTASNLRETQEGSFKAGCNGFLTKPIKMDQLWRTLQQYSEATSEAASEVLATPSAERELEVADEMNRLKSRFLRSRHDDASTLQTAVEARNFSQIRTIGHRIKGLAGSYGLEAIGTTGHNIEQAALDRDIDRVTTELSNLRKALQEAEQINVQGPGYDSHAA